MFHITHYNHILRAIKHIHITIECLVKCCSSYNWFFNLFVVDDDAFSGFNEINLYSLSICLNDAANKTNLLKLKKQSAHNRKELTNTQTSRSIFLKFQTFADCSTDNQCLVAFDFLRHFQYDLSSSENIQRRIKMNL